MLTPKILIEAFIINLVLIVVTTLISAALKGVLGPASYYSMEYVYSELVSIILLITIYKERADPLSNVFILGIIAYLVVGRGFGIAYASGLDNFLGILLWLVLPAFFLAVSFYFFRKKLLNLAKAISFIVVCFFLNSTIFLILSKIIPDL
jgi:hypothetical protein